jgi:hypothetical protein
MKNRVKGRGFFISYNTRIAVFFSFSTNGREWKMGGMEEGGVEEGKREKGDKGGGRQRKKGGRGEYNIVTNQDRGKGFL